MKVWITSDTHFYHFNIIKYCNRPFPTVDLMNSALIKNWNDSIQPDDIILFLGDFCFARSAEAANVTERLTYALNGRKIIVKGNHDFKQVRYTEHGWGYECFQEFVFNDRFCFRHRPDNLITDSKYYDFIFFGHVHNTPLDYAAPLNCINVCMDANDLKPLDITNYFTTEEIKQLNELVGE